LQQLKEAGFQINLEKPHSGTLQVHQTLGRVEIEPEEVLRIQVSDTLGQTAFESVIFGPKLLTRQTEFLGPVKFAVGEDLTQLQLTGELPLNGKASLPIAYQLLYDAILDACSKNAELQTAGANEPVLFVKPPDKKRLKEGQPQVKEQTFPSKGVSATACRLPTAEIKNQLEMTCKNPGDELVEQTDGWRLSFSTRDYFQQITIALDQGAGVMRCRATLVVVPKERSVVQIALAAFLLEASSRLRFVRGVMFEDPSTSQMTIALEVLLPGQYSKVLSPRVAIESLKTATRFTKLGCEAISEADIAKEYLCRRANIVRQKLQGEFT
jgi:hypothetical protein